MPAPESKANTASHKSYEDFRFRVKWDGNYVAGVSKVSALARTTDAVQFRTEGDPSAPRVLPGQSAYQPVTLERGVTYDATFVQWANKVWDYRKAAGIDPDGSLKDFRKDIVIELFNEAGEKVLAYNVYRCWVSEFVAMPELDGAGNAIAIQSIVLENEGWERDQSVGES